MSGRRGLQDGLGFGSVERDSSFNKLKNFLSLSVFFLGRWYDGLG